MSVVHLIVVTWSSGPPASGKIIKEMPGSVVSGTLYIASGDSSNSSSSMCPSLCIFLLHLRVLIIIIKIHSYLVLKFNVTIIMRCQTKPIINFHYVGHLNSLHLTHC